MAKNTKYLGIKHPRYRILKTPGRAWVFQKQRMIKNIIIEKEGKNNWISLNSTDYRLFRKSKQK